MKRFLTLITSIEYWFDFTVGYMMTRPSNLPFYHRVMYQRYGERYCTKEQFEAYWDEISYMDVLD
jgi:hypothetical protein